ncbi:MAG: hypothetical protein D4R65_04430 [Verrucomicrobiaceae bacterium]|nr:MAG: hypothetical protein D4R65_04430 [Verrucomicrobiaceae bacterium]
MKPATEEFLYALLWTMDVAARPTWRRLGESYEGWAYRHGLLRRIRQLEAQGVIEVKDAPGEGRAVRLTEAGMKIARRGVHPPALWAREWDGRWRIAFFDLKEDKVRARLRRALRDLRFGCLQRSVWISPDSSSSIKDALAGENVDVTSLAIFDGQPASGEKDSEIVKASWDFDKIGRLYKNWQQNAALVETPVAWERMIPSDRNEWFREERRIWGAIIREDPFLPAALLPDGYPGKTVWEQRVKLLPRLFV